jgi:molybdopterin-guanine dinucleotide biosynthesis protein A
MVAVGGVPMLSRVVAAAVGAGARGVVVVGPARDGLGDGVLNALEEPAGGGPVAAAAAGLDVLEAACHESDIVALLAADMPQLSAAALGVLIERLDGYDGALFVDGDGRRQLLCGVWRRAALVEAIAGFGTLAGGSLRALVRGLRVVEVRWAGGGAPYFDCDTEDDLRKVEL